MANGSSLSGIPPRHAGRGLWLVWVVTLVAGCAGQSAFLSSGGPDYDPSLISGERLFGAPLPVDELPSFSITEPSQAMRDYVAGVIGETRAASRRFQLLFRNLHRDGYFEAVYSADTTLTAADAFEAQGGNCLSYTNMFVALAREAGLNARFQMVDVPPSWDADSGFLIRYSHINVVLENVSLDLHPGDMVVVDFNDVHPDPDYPSRVVSDAFAESLFYANHSVELLRNRQVRDSFLFLRRAIEISPENVDLWINLGAFYATQGDYASALEAHQVALQIEPRNKAAYSGLARSYANLGDQEQAAIYEEKVRRYRERNPYYHFALAQAAFDEANFERSLEYIEAAIDLRHRTPKFHLFKGVVEQRLGDPEAAEESFRRARRYGLDQRVKLDMLRALAGVTPS